MESGPIPLYPDFAMIISVMMPCIPVQYPADGGLSRPKCRLCQETEQDCCYVDLKRDDKKRFDPPLVPVGKFCIFNRQLISCIVGCRKADELEAPGEECGRLGRMTKPHNKTPVGVSIPPIFSANTLSLSLIHTPGREPSRLDPKNIW